MIATGMHGFPGTATVRNIEHQRPLGKPALSFLGKKEAEEVLDEEEPPGTPAAKPAAKKPKKPKPSETAAAEAVTSSGQSGKPKPKRAREDPEGGDLGTAVIDESETPPRRSGVQRMKDAMGKTQ